VLKRKKYSSENKGKESQNTTPKFLLGHWNGDSKAANLNLPQGEFFAIFLIFTNNLFYNQTCSINMFLTG